MRVECDRTRIAIDKSMTSALVRVAQVKNARCVITTRRRFFTHVVVVVVHDANNIILLIQNRVAISRKTWSLKVRTKNDVLTRRLITIRGLG